MFFFIEVFKVKFKRKDIHIIIPIYNILCALFFQFLYSAGIKSSKKQGNLTLFYFMIILLYFDIQIDR